MEEKKESRESVTGRVRESERAIEKEKERYIEKEREREYQPVQSLTHLSLFPVIFFRAMEQLFRESFNVQCMVLSKSHSQA